MAIDYARQREALRVVTRFSGQRLTEERWGMYVEGTRKNGDAVALKVRIESDGSIVKVS
jgi:hypothetical protein